LLAATKIYASPVQAFPTLATFESLGPANEAASCVQVTLPGLGVVFANGEPVYLVFENVSTDVITAYIDIEGTIPLPDDFVIQVSSGAAAYPLGLAFMNDCSDLAPVMDTNDEGALVCSACPTGTTYQMTGLCAFEQGAEHKQGSFGTGVDPALAKTSSSSPAKNMIWIWVLIALLGAAAAAWFVLKHKRGLVPQDEPATQTRE
jgi:hypothetical protein